MRMILALLTLSVPAQAQVLTGERAFGDVTTDKPGLVRKIGPDDLPKPGVRVGSASSRLVTRSDSMTPLAPEGFQVSLLASGLSGPRRIRVAPNGDLFIAETNMGRVLVLREGQKPQLFASDLDGAFGLQFWPADNPQYLYVATEREVVRIPYHDGDLKARGKPERIVSGLAAGGHSTRDLAFSPDGRTMYVSVGSLSNNARGMGAKPGDIAAFERTHGVGATWGNEEWRAAVIAFDADGKNKRPYANGLRNCAGLTMHMASGLPWCAVNERDMLGDDLPPDYATSVREGGFYGWPWYYIGRNEEPAHAKARPDLADKTIAPDVLIQAHSAPLGIVFDNRNAMDESIRGSGFVALHGSWNRSKVTGYKVVRLVMRGGRATGEYEDFLTGFALPDGRLWGRPVAVEITRDGALLVSEDGGGTIWKVSAKD